VVVTTLFPQYTFAQVLAGDLIELSIILPYGSSAHTFDPEPSTVIEVLEADLLLYTTPLLETWVDDLITSQENSDVKAIDLSLGITLLDGHEDEEGEAHEEDEIYDPHYWIDPLNALIMAESIASELKLLLPDHIDTIDANWLVLQGMINDWHEANLDLVAHAQLTTLIHGGHNAFGYFTHRYELDYITPYEGFSTDSQPTPSALIALMETMESLGVDMIYTEEIVSPTVAQTIAEQTNATIEQLSTGGSINEAAFLAGVTFFDIMYTNIDKLKGGLRYDINYTNPTATSGQ
jgi:zinc transport system substrate-binding protein